MFTQFEMYRVCVYFDDGCFEVRFDCRFIWKDT